MPARPATITTDSRTEISTPGQSLVWDLPTRAFHWLLVLSLCASWFTAEAGIEWIETHNLLGYCALTLVLFRLFWGIAGARYARFASFVCGPKTVLAAIPKLFSRQRADDIGHNPIGGWSAVLMLLMVAVQAGTGLFIDDDVMHFGPYNHVISSSLAGTLAQIHHLNFQLLQLFVLLHVAAILWYRFGKDTDLVRPMLSGKKKGVDAASGIPSSLLPRAFILLAAAVAIVTAIVQLAPVPTMNDFSF